MSSLSKVRDAELRRLLGNQCLSKVTLAINAGSAATIKTTGATIFSIDGVLYTKAALLAQSFAVTHNACGEAVGGDQPPAYVQPVLTTVFYLVCLNAAGTVAIVQGSYEGQSIAYPNDLSKVLTGKGGRPKEPEGYTAIGVVKIALAGAATFTPGTTALDAANVTATYYDVSRLPASL